MREFLSIVFSTFISEDLTCIGSGILARLGRLDLNIAIFASLTGIFFGDLLIYLLAYLFQNRIFRFKKIREMITEEKLIQWRKELTERLGVAIIISRFTPGTRLPMHLASGLLRISFFLYTFYTLIACILWTPILVLLAFFYGESFKKFYEEGNIVTGFILSITSAYLIYIIIKKTLIAKERKETILFFQKYSRLEYWPTTFLYAPLVFYLAYLSLRYIRYGGFSVITCSNPGIFLGGIAGESKYEILSSIKSNFVSKSALISPGDRESFKEKMQSLGLTYPVIMKPDRGERGRSLRLVSSEESAIEFLKSIDQEFILQEYHPGPFEAGIFYYRIPGTERGKIYSITDKVFSHITGDGISHISDLIINHERYRFQKNTFQKILGKDWEKVLADGEKIQLGFTGNHFQGCMFLDGSHLITKELELKIDEIAKSFEGFYFGRFDIRYSDPEELKQGRGFKVIELNGATSESTNIYDPSFSHLKSYKIFAKQWKILFLVSVENKKRGVKRGTVLQIINSVFAHNAKSNTLDDYSLRI